jgi:EmrB/QacA subfamily drug resistance transporter
MDERIPAGDTDTGAGHAGVVTDHTPADRGMPRGRIRVALIIIVTCQLMVVLDATIVNIALPRIQESLSVSSSDLSWVVNAYTLAFGGLLLLGGRTGDILGRRRVLVAGVCLFTLSSLLGGFATSGPWLLAARGGQGIGAAFVAPGALAMIMTTFKEGKSRARAIGIYAASSASGMMIGLILGGVLIAWASWRWIFFINVPIGAAVAVLAPSFLHESQRRPGRFDASGALASTAGLVSLVYGFIRAASVGWQDHVTVGAFAVAAMLLATFAVIEARAVQPIMPLRLLADRTRASCCAVRMLLTASMNGMMFILTLYLQEVLGFSPIQFGLAILPSTIPYLILGRVLTPLIQRVGAKPVVVAGALITTVSMLWLSRVSDATTFVSGVLGPNVLAGAGVGILFVATTFAALSRVRPQETGAASGLLQTMQQIGGSLGVALLVTVLGATSGTVATHPLAHLTGQARHVLVHGISNAFLAGTVLAVGVLVASLALGRTNPVRQGSGLPALSNRS